MEQGAPQQADEDPSNDDCLSVPRLTKSVSLLLEINELLQDGASDMGSLPVSRYCSEGVRRRRQSDTGTSLPKQVRRSRTLPSGDYSDLRFLPNRCAGHHRTSFTRQGKLDLLVCCAGPSLERARPLLSEFQHQNVLPRVLTDADLHHEDIAKTFKESDAVLVLWSIYFHGEPAKLLLELTQIAREAGALILNDMLKLVDMQDRIWLHDTMLSNGIPVPATVVCSRENARQPSLEEKDDYIVIDGKRIKKPFVEKPVDRRNRDIYIYFPKAAGGGRSLAATYQSGDVEYVFRFEPVSRVRREGSYIYQEYLQSEGFMVQAVCVGDLAFGNAVLSGVVHSSGPPQQKSPGSASCRSPGLVPGTPTSETHPSDPSQSSCAIRLRQEEKAIASKLNVILGQAFFGITFARSNRRADGESSDSLQSFVIDVWPAIPRAGLGAHCEDVVRALLATIRKRLMPWWSVARAQNIHLDRGEANEQSLRSPSSGECNSPSGENSVTFTTTPAGEYADCLCVLLVARHSERTPKQKVKAKFTLQSEFETGWLMGWLAGEDAEVRTAVSPPLTFELRSNEQMERLESVVEKLVANGHDLTTMLDALGNVRKENLSCHAKLEVEGAKMKVAIKWGGELTHEGIKEAEEFGANFREEVYPAEVINELHTTFRHDLKVYASPEPRCQQTAAAFCRGLLHLSSQLPQIVAALVQTDKFEGVVPKATGGSYEELDATEALLLPSLDLPWEEVEALANGPCVSTSLRMSFDCPRSALVALVNHLERFVEHTKGPFREPLYGSETPVLLRVRYNNALDDLKSLKKESSFDLSRAQRILDHLLYDKNHNLEALPEESHRDLLAALPLCESLCDIATPLEFNCKRQATNGVTAGLLLLHKLRWDLRVASGVDPGDGTASERHDQIYTSEVEMASGGPCVRTRLYFNHNSRLQALLRLLLRGSKNEERSRSKGDAPSIGADVCGDGGCGCGSALEEPGYKRTISGGSYSDGVAMHPRLGFLSHIQVRMWRLQADHTLQVTCEFSKSGEEPRQTIFEMPLAEVDAWWSRELIPLTSMKGSEIMKRRADST